MNIRAVKVALVLLTCFIINGAWEADSFSKDSDDFQFVVMGDNRPWVDAGDKITQNKYFLGNIRRANELKPDFTVIVGDLILGYEGNADILNREWNAFDAACKDFKEPYYLVVGNHDVWDKASEDVWKKRNGKLYYSWEHKGCYFIALDSEVVGEQGKITGEQLKWLKDELIRDKSAHRIFVFLHEPLWRNEPSGNENTNQWFRDVHPLLAKYGVDTVFAGHWHCYNLSPAKDGVRYVITGGAGAELDGYQLGGGFFHLLLVDIKGNASDFKIIAGEKEFPADYVTDKKIKALDDSLVVDLPQIAKDKEVIFRLKVKNPLQKQVRAIVRWDTKGTSWRGDDKEITIAAGQTGALDAEARIGEKIMPIPKATIELMDGDTKLYGWYFLSKATSSLGDFITEWDIAGPFDLGLTVNKGDDRKEADKRFMTTTMNGWDGLVAPEKNFSFSDSYEGKAGKKIHWETARADSNGYLDIDRLYGNAIDYAVACAVAYVYSPEDMRYEMSVGSDDSILVRINGKEVLRKRVLRGAGPDQDVFEADLKKGRNEVFLKIADNWGGWGFYFRVIDPEKSLKFSVKPE